MARIAGVDLPREKRVEIALTYIYGIGRKTANDILAATGVNPDTRVKDMTEEDEAKIREYIDHHLIVEGDKRRDVALMHLLNLHQVRKAWFIFQRLQKKESNM